jgi:hypothetical protein
MSEQDNIPEQLSAYLDGELSPDETRDVERALEADERLAGELARLQAVRGMVRQLPRQRAGDEFVSRVLERAERAHLVAEPEQVFEHGVLRWARHAATAAMILIAVGIGGIIAVTLLKTPDMTNVASSSGGHGEVRARYAKDLSPSASRAPADSLSDSKLAMGQKITSPGGVPLPCAPDSGDYLGRGAGAESQAGGGPVVCYNFVIEAPDLERARRSVEGMLGKDRGLSKVQTSDSIPESKGGDKYGYGRMEVTQTDDRQVQYRLRMTADQAKQLGKDIEQLRLQKDRDELAMLPGGPAMDEPARPSALKTEALDQEKKELGEQIEQEVPKLKADTAGKASAGAREPAGSLAPGAGMQVRGEKTQPEKGIAVASQSVLSSPAAAGAPFAKTSLPALPSPVIAPVGKVPAPAAPCQVNMPATAAAFAPATMPADAPAVRAIEGIAAERRAGETNEGAFAGAQATKLEEGTAPQKTQSELKYKSTANVTTAAGELEKVLKRDSKAAEANDEVEVVITLTKVAAEVGGAGRLRDLSAASRPAAATTDKTDAAK